MADTQETDGEMSIQDLTTPPADAPAPDLPGDVQEPDKVVPPIVPPVVPPLLSQKQLDDIAARTTDMIEAHEMIVRLLAPIFEEPGSPSREIARNLTKILVNHSRSVVVEDLQRRIRKIANERDAS